MRFSPLDLLLVVGVDQEREHRAVDARRPARSRTGRSARFVSSSKYASFLPECSACAREVEVGAVGDPLELRPADREEVLDVGGSRWSSATARPRRARAGAGCRAGCRGSVYQSQPLVHPVARTTRSASPGGQKNSISICSNSRVRKMKLPGRDLVAERLADLRDAERQLLARELEDVLEVDEDPLRRLRAQVDRRAGVLRPGPTCVLNIRLNWRGSVSSPPALARHAWTACWPHCDVLELVGAEAQLARLAVDHRVGEARDVAGGLPDPRVHEDRRVERRRCRRARCTIARHQASLTLFFSSTPSGP